MEKLLEHIAGIQGKGSFCTAGILDTCMPGIRIKGYGEISLPLQEKEIQNMEKYFSDAPYGKGAETLLDKNVRSTKELDPDRFSVNNPEWKISMDKAVSEIAARLGLGKSKITYSLYKLLLYTEGDFFLPHRDTEKEDRMFGTMVVALPSVHTGGDLMIKHDDQTEKISFSSRKYQYKAGYAAFYADCEHEVKKIKKGARICLIYNLKMEDCIVQPDLQSLNYQSVQAEALLRKSKMKTDKAFLLLKHQYTEKNFSKNALKNSDILKTEILFQAALKTGYSAHLALVTLNKIHNLESDYNEYFDEENDEVGGMIDSVLAARCWFDSEGRSVPFGEMYLEESEVFSSEPFGAGEADEKVKNEYTGNAGATVDLWYRKAAVALWKKKDHFSVLAKSLSIDASVPLLFKYVKHRSSQFEKKDLISFADEIIGQWKPDVYWDSTALLNQMLGILNILSDADLTKRFFRKVLSVEYRRSSAKIISESLYHHGIEKFQTELKLFVKADAERLKTDFPEILFCIVQSAANSPKGLRICRDLSKEFLSALSETDRKISEKNEKRKGEFREENFELGGVEIFSPDGIHSVILSFIFLDSEEFMEKIVSHFVKYPKIYSAEKLLAPTLLRIEKPVFKKSDSLQRLGKYCIEILKEKAVSPKEPSDWKQNTVILCSCRDCQSLNQFMKDPDLKILKISVSKDRRSHLHRQMENYNCNMTHITDRRTSPETLVFTKTTGEFDRKMKTAEANQKLLKALKKKIKH